MSAPAALNAKKVALLLMILSFIPVLLGSVAVAKKLKYNGVHIYMVNGNGKLRMYDNSPLFSTELDWGRRKWNHQNNADLKFNDSNCEVRVINQHNCNLDANAFTLFYPQDANENLIRWNSCLMEWPGGVYPADDAFRGPTPVDRRFRTAAHELGHALGLNHRNGNEVTECDTVMKSIPSWKDSNCPGPSQDDLDEVEGFN